MSYPLILQKFLKNEGAGPLIKPELLAEIETPDSSDSDAEIISISNILSIPKNRKYSIIIMGG
ncbi:MAG: hypothetical protein LBT40_04830 [Deltaproteobacteria bacterium]|jgi:hypothetical protein|nr:hypothetical protein [Deltaproteobacteria bacterium]